MKTLTTQELKSIEQFFQLRQPSILKAMHQFLISKYNDVICTSDYLIALGDIPIALVAHLDTVFTAPPKNIFYDKEKNVMWSPDGLGADDRAGVFSIIQIVRSGLRPTIIFTADEEKGCVGAYNLIEKIPHAPTELKYIIQLDRHGSNDCVFYDCDNPEFAAYIESFGFITNFGSFTDISEICPAWKIAGVNLSIGYYNEHSYTETLYIGQMFSTINKVKKMLLAANEAKSFEYKEKIYASSIKKPLNSQLDLEWDPSYGVSKEEWYSFMEPQIRCADCKSWEFDYNLFPVKVEPSNVIFLCADCISKRKDIAWCNICGEPFISAQLDNICMKCRGKMDEVKSAN